jgi:hypothetical protein
MSYYLIDAGDEMAELAIGTYEALKKLEHHVVSILHRPSERDDNNPTR